MLLAGVGGVLQYAYTSTTHPSVALKIWGVFYGAFEAVAVLVLLISAVGLLRRIRRGQTRASNGRVTATPLLQALAVVVLLVGGTLALVAAPGLNGP